MRYIYIRAIIMPKPIHINYFIIILSRKIKIYFVSY
jgi:hypothetical protein